jgi:outer membrane protein OmpA-like peptidoglycan-associated protein
MTCRKATAAAIASAVVVVGIGGEAFGQTRTRRSIEGPVTRELVVRSLTVVPVAEEAGASGRVDPRPLAQVTGFGADVALSGPVELSVMLHINFALESAKLTPGARRDLDQVAAALLDRRLVGVPVMLEGHTDATGAAAYNLNLSQRRAAAVLTYLVSRGVVPDRLQAVGYGEHRLLSGRSPSDGLQRRVEIVRTF